MAWFELLLVRRLLIDYEHPGRNSEGHLANGLLFETNLIRVREKMNQGQQGENL